MLRKGALDHDTYNLFIPSRIKAFRLSNHNLKTNKKNNLEKRGSCWHISSFLVLYVNFPYSIWSFLKKMSHLLDSVPFKQGLHLQILSQSPASPWRWGMFLVLKNCTSGIKALIFTPKEFGVVTEDFLPSLVGVAPDFSEDYPSRHNSISLVQVRVFPFAGRASASPFQDRIIVCFLGLIKWKTISFEFSFFLINTFNCFFLCLFVIIGSYFVSIALFPLRHGPAVWWKMKKFQGQN